MRKIATFSLDKIHATNTSSIFLRQDEAVYLATIDQTCSFSPHLFFSPVFASKRKSSDATNACLRFMFARRLGNRARELLRVAARGKYSTIHLRRSLLLLYHPPLLLLLLLLAPLLLPLFSSRFHLVFQSHHGVFFVASSPSLSFAISLFLTYSSLLLGPSFFPLLVLMPVPFSPSLFSEVCLPSTRNCLSFSLLVFSFSFLLSLFLSCSCSLAFSLPRTSRAMNSR